MSESVLKIGLVGVCGAGKTTLTERLKAYYPYIRQIAQEHSYVPDMWQRLVDPDVLIYLSVSYPLTLQRKSFTWKKDEYNKQEYRLRHAYEHADLHVDTDNLTPDEILDMVLAFLEQSGHPYIDS